MSTAFRRKGVDGDQGFTLIELLVVIIIISILAAIVIPTYINHRRKAWATQVKADLKNASVAAESYATDHNASYATLTEAALVDEGFNPSPDVTVQVTPGLNDFTLQGEHLRMPGTWTYDSNTGQIAGP